MERLYEKFILEYYCAHHPHFRATPAQVKWDLDDDNDERALMFLPTMQTDITLRGDVRTLIIDAKYCGRIMLEHHNSESVRSAHPYQIYTYVKNLDTDHTGNAKLLNYDMSCHPPPNMLSWSHLVKRAAARVCEGRRR